MLSEATPLREWGSRRGQMLRLNTETVPRKAPADPSEALELGYLQNCPEPRCEHCTLNPCIRPFWERCNFGPSVMAVLGGNPAVRPQQPIPSAVNAWLGRGIRTCPAASITVLTCFTAWFRFSSFQLPSPNHPHCTSLLPPLSGWGSILGKLRPCPWVQLQLQISFHPTHA